MDELFRQKIFKKQSKIALFHFVVEIPYVIFAIVMAVMSRSLIMMMDAINTTITLIHTGTLLVTSRKLQKNSLFRYDYGMGKIEAFGAFFAGILLYFGFAIIIKSSVLAFFHHIQPSDMLIVAIVMKVVALLIAIKFHYYHVKLIKQAHSKILSSGLALARKSLWFEAISLVVLAISFSFRFFEWIVYFEPAACIILAVYLMIKEFKPAKEAVDDLLDRTADEGIQHKVLRCVAPVFDDFEEFRGIRTRQSGEIIYIELLLSFSPDKKYADIDKLLNNLTELMLKEIPDGKVSIVLQKY